MTGAGRKAFLSLQNMLIKNTQTEKSYVLPRKRFEVFRSKHALCRHHRQVGGSIAIRAMKFFDLCSNNYIIGRQLDVVVGT